MKKPTKPRKPKQIPPRFEECSTLSCKEISVDELAEKFSGCVLKLDGWDAHLRVGKYIEPDPIEYEVRMEHYKMRLAKYKKEMEKYIKFLQKELGE